MKTASVREVQHRLAGILEEVRRGQTVQVTHRGRVVAQISPAAESRGPLRWPDSLARMRRRFGGAPLSGAPPSRLIEESRGERG